MSAGWALCWEMWARQRWVVLATVVYLVTVIVLGRVLPLETWRSVGGLEVIPLMLALPVILASVCRGFEGRAEGAGSMLPERVLVLPVSARALVTWSLVTGAVPLALLWPLCVLVLRWPLARVPLVWPGLLVFNVVGWLQVLCWMPFGAPYLRLWIAGLGAGGLIGGTVYLRETVGVSEPVVAGLLCGFGLAAFAVGVAGVRCARHGDGIGFEDALKEFFTGIAGLARARRGADTVRVSWRLQESRPLVEQGPFLSPAQALFWFNWRAFRWSFLWLAGFSLVVGLPLFSLILRPKHSPLVDALGLSPALAPGWLLLCQLLWVPFLICLGGWDELGRVHLERRGWQGSFLLVHPVSTASLVAAKLRLCALWVLLGGLPVVAIGVGWVLATGRWVEMSDQLIAVSGSGWAAVLVLASGVLALFALAWGQMAAGLWVSLSGRRWAVWVGGGILVVALGGVPILLSFIAADPDFRAALGRLLPAIMAGALVLKVMLTIGVFRANLQRRLLSGHAVVLALAAWATFAAGLFAGLAWLIPAEVVGRVPLAEGVALAVPIARIGLAPLALAWNRHR